MNRFLLASLSLVALMNLSAQETLRKEETLRHRSVTETAALKIPQLSKQLKSRMQETSVAPTREYILGDYDIDYFDQYNSRDISDIATISAGDGPDDVIFSIPIDLGSFGGRPVVDFPAKYSNGILTFTSGVPLEITINDREFTDDLFLYHWRDDESDFDFVETASATWIGYGFAFDDDDIFCMADPKDAIGAWFAIGQIITEKDLTQNPDFNYNEGWTSLGMAHIQDGWVLPGFEMNQFKQENIWEVELQQNDLDSNIYRLVNPYKGNSPVAEFNESQRLGFIQFDVTYPEYVTFFPVNAGFAYADLGINKFYCQNFLTYMMGAFGYPAEDIIEEFESPSMQWGNFKDGIVHLPYFIDGEYGVANDACFGMQGKVYSASNWVTENPDFLLGEPVNMDTKIYFPGVYENLSVKLLENKDEVKYYSLQGLPIANPSKGQIVIRIQGSVTEKIIF